MAASGGTWTKGGAAGATTRVFVPKGSTVQAVLGGNRPKGSATSTPYRADSVVFPPGGHEQGAINGVAMGSAKPGFWKDVWDVPVGDESWPPGSKKRSAGCVIVEPDGRVWIYEPKGHYGGYQHTFPKGGLDKGLTDQQNALREVFEETGLQAEITGMVGHFEGDTSTTRFYLARRIGGSPGDQGTESQSVKLVPKSEAAVLLNKQRDQDVLAALDQVGGKQPSAKPAAAPAANPTTAPASKPGEVTWPESPAATTTVKSLGGSTGTKLVTAGGQQYVLKRGNSPEHLLEESYADAAYEVLGARVAPFKVYQQPGGPVKLAEFVQGKALADLHGVERQRAYASLQRNFAADALLSNWDVIGLDADNILYGGGKTYRIDNGGSLRFRAQGKAKGDAFGNFPMEVWSLRESSQGKPVFGSMTIGQVAAQAKAMAGKRQQLLGVMPKALHATVGARFDRMQQLSRIHSVLSRQGVKDGQIDGFVRKLWTGVQNGSIKDPASDADIVKLYKGG